MPKPGSRDNGGVSRTPTFQALRERNARLFFGGLLISNIGTWAQLTATTLLVKGLAGKHPGQALGMVIMLQFLPMLLLGAWAGGFADQRNRRRLTIITQAAMTLQAIVMTVLDFAHLVTLPMAYGLSLVLGLAAALDNPARRGVVLELVDTEHINNAMALNTAVMTGSRIFGPAIAAWLVVAYGTRWCFLINAVSFVGVLGALLLIDPSKLRVLERAPRGGTPVRDGLRLVWRDPTLRLVFFVMTVTATFVFNFPVSLPLLADSRFKNASLYGWLLAVTSVGSLLGSLVMASRPVMSLRSYLGSVVILGSAAIALAYAPNATFAFIAAVPVGFGGALLIVGANSIAQSLTPPTMRSRLLALAAVAFLGSTPIGGPITGWVGDHLGAEWSLAYGGIIAVACAAFSLLMVRRIEAGRRAVTAGSQPVGETARMG
jgi:MFS family permease